MVIHAIHKAPKGDADRLIKILDMHTTDQSLIKEAISIIDRYGSKEYAAGVAEKIVIEAWKDIDGRLEPSEAKDRLKQLAEFLIKRLM
jgi:geranylgeranyl diphosphate synthase type 3/geranylgeranyl diphosphate synthase type I